MGNKPSVKKQPPPAGSSQQQPQQPKPPIPVLPSKPSTPTTPPKQPENVWMSLPDNDGSLDFIRDSATTPPDTELVTEAIGRREGPVLYDFFVATHSNDCDTAIGEKLAAHLREIAFRGRLLRVFYEKDWNLAVSSASWQYPFQCSVVVLLLISERLLQDIQNLEGSASEIVLLLELTLWRANEKKCGVLPLFVENEDATPMKFYDMKKFSDAKHRHPRAIDSSVRDTLTNLFKLQGRPLPLTDNFVDRVPDIIGLLETAYKNHVHLVPLAVVDGVYRHINAVVSAPSSDAGPSLYVASFQLQNTYSEKPEFGHLCVSSPLTGEVMQTLHITFENDEIIGYHGRFKAVISPDMVSLVINFTSDNKQSKLKKLLIANGAVAWERSYPDIADIAFVESSYLAMVSYAGAPTVSLLSLKNGQVLSTLVSSIAKSWYHDRVRPTLASTTAIRDNNIIIAFGYEYNLLVWTISKTAADLPGKIPLAASRKVAERDGVVARVAFSADGSLLAVAYHRLGSNASDRHPQDILVYSLKSPISFNIFQKYTFSLVLQTDYDAKYGFLCLSPDNLRMFAGGRDDLKIFNLASFSEERSFAAPRRVLKGRGHSPHHEGFFLPNAIGMVAVGASQIDFWILGASNTVRLVQSINFPSHYPITTAVFARLDTSSSVLYPAHYETMSKNSAEEFKPISATGRVLCVAEEQDSESCNVAIKEINSREKKMTDLKSLVIHRRRAHFILPVCELSLVLEFSVYFLPDQGTEGRYINAYSLLDKGGHQQKPVYSQVFTSTQASIGKVLQAVVGYNASLVWYMFGYEDALLVAMDPRNGKHIRAIRPLLNTDGTMIADNRISVHQFVLSPENTRLLFCCSDGIRFRYVGHVAANSFIPAGEVRQAVFLHQNLCAFIDSRSKVVVADYIRGSVLSVVTAEANAHQGLALFPGLRGSFWLQLIDNRICLMQSSEKKIILDGSPSSITSKPQRGRLTVSPNKSFIMGGGRTAALLFRFKSGSYRNSETALWVKEEGTPAVVFPFEDGFGENEKDFLQVCDPVNAADTKMLNKLRMETDDIFTQQLQQLLGRASVAVADSGAPNNADNNTDSKSKSNASTKPTLETPTIAIKAVAEPMAAASPPALKKAIHWRCKIDKTLKHDIFISYRVWCEKDLSLKLGLHLRFQAKKNGRRDDTVIVFLDRLCLNDGEDWEHGFLNGLAHSTLVVLLISQKTFLGIFDADKRQDNVLLEYEYALRMAEKKQILLLPLMVNNEDFSLCQFPDLEKFPDVKHASPKSISPSIRGTMQKLRDNYQRYPISPTDSYMDATGTILQHLEDAENLAIHQQSRLKALMPDIASNDAPRQMATIRVSSYDDGQLHISSPTAGATSSSFPPLFRDSHNIISHICLPSDEETISTVYFSAHNHFQWILAAWNVKIPSTLRWSVPLSTAKLHSMILSSNSSFIVCAAAEECNLHNVLDGSIRGKIAFTAKQSQGCTCVSLSPDDKLLFSCCQGGVDVWELRTLSILSRHEFRGVDVERLSLSRLGNNVLVYGKERNNLLLLAKTDRFTGDILKNPVHELPGNTSRVVSAALSPTGTYVASVNADGDLRLYSVDSLQLLWKREFWLWPNSTLIFSPDETLLACIPKSTDKALTCYSFVSVKDSGVVWQDKGEATAMALSYLIVH